MYGDWEHSGPTELGEFVRKSVRRTQSGKIENIIFKKYSLLVNALNHLAHCAVSLK